MKVFRKKPAASHLSRMEALKYTPSKSRQISEIRLETGEVIIEYPLVMRPLIAAVAKRLKGLEKENSELKKVVAELTLDNRMLKDVVSKKW